MPGTPTPTTSGGFPIRQPGESQADYDNRVTQHLVSVNPSYAKQAQYEGTPGSSPKPGADATPKPGASATPKAGATPKPGPTVQGGPGKTVFSKDSPVTSNKSPYTPGVNLPLQDLLGSAMSGNPVTEGGYGEPFDGSINGVDARTGKDNGAGGAKGGPTTYGSGYTPRAPTPPAARAAYGPYLAGDLAARTIGIDMATRVDPYSGTRYTMGSDGTWRESGTLGRTEMASLRASGALPPVAQEMQRAVGQTAPLEANPGLRNNVGTAGMTTSLQPGQTPNFAGLNKDFALPGVGFDSSNFTPKTIAANNMGGGMKYETPSSYIGGASGFSRDTPGGPSFFRQVDIPLNIANPTFNPLAKSAPAMIQPNAQRDASGNWFSPEGPGDLQSSGMTSPGSSVDAMLTGPQNLNINGGGVGMGLNTEMMLKGRTGVSQDPVERALEALSIYESQANAPANSSGQGYSVGNGTYQGKSGGLQNVEKTPTGAAFSGGHVNLDDSRFSPMGAYTPVMDANGLVLQGANGSDMTPAAQGQALKDMGMTAPAPTSNVGAVMAAGNAQAANPGAPVDYANAGNLPHPDALAALGAANAPVAPVGPALGAAPAPPPGTVDAAQPVGAVAPPPDTGAPPPETFSTGGNVGVMADGTGQHSMTTPEEIIGIGAKTGKHYFTVGEPTQAGGPPMAEKLHITPLHHPSHFADGGDVTAGAPGGGGGGGAVAPAGPALGDGGPPGGSALAAPGQFAPPPGGGAGHPTSKDRGIQYGYSPGPGNLIQSIPQQPQMTNVDYLRSLAGGISNKVRMSLPAA